MLRVITWNMQGSNISQDSKWTSGVSRFFNKLGADVVCLQECGTPPPSSDIQTLPFYLPFLGKQPLERRTKRNGGGANVRRCWVYYSHWPNPGFSESERAPFTPVFHVLSLVWDVAAHRVNLAIVTAQSPQAILTGGRGISHAHGNEGARPSLGVRVLDDQQSTWDVFSFHGLAGSGNDDPGVLKKVAAIQNLSNKWGVFGDFNREPDSLVNALAQRNILLAVNRPDKPTHNQSKYDYMVSPTPQHQGTTMDQFNLSDHYPVVYDVV